MMLLFFRRLACLGALLGIIVVGLGAYTRLADAGLGCPDWPSCYGQLIGVPNTPQELHQAAKAYPQALPVVSAKAWPEVIHRYFAGTLGFIIMALFAMSLKLRKQLDQSSMYLTSALMLLLIGQAILGMWTVTMLLLPLVVMSHLMGGMIITTLLWALFLRNTAIKLPHHTSPSLRTMMVLGGILLLLQILLGGWTSTNYAALICTDFPTCLHTWLPKMNFSQGFHFLSPVGINYQGGILSTEARTAIQITHRLGALVVVIYFSTLITLLYKRAPMLKPLTNTLLLLLILQVLLGISNVLFLLPMTIAVSHNMIALCLLLTLTTLWTCPILQSEPT